MGQAENCGEMEHCDGGIEHAAIEHAAIEHAVGGNPIIHCARAAGTVVRCADARSPVGIRCAGNPARGKDNADHAASGEEEVGFEE